MKKIITLDFTNSLNQGKSLLKLNLKSLVHLKTLLLEIGILLLTAFLSIINNT